MTLKKIAAVALALVTAVSAQADLNTRERIPLAVTRTSSGTAYDYCTMLGQDSSPTGAWKKGRPEEKVITDGALNAASATIAEATDTDPWADLAVGDIVRFAGNKPATDNERVLITKTSASSAVFNRVIDLDPDTPTNANETSGFNFQYRTRSCASTTPTAAAGYLAVEAYEAGNFLLIVESESGATSGADYQLLCYAGGASIAAVIVASGNVTQAQAAAGQAVAIGEWNIGNYGFSHCALGVQADAGAVVYSAYFIAKNTGGR
jgi:hypothetical protein